MKIPTPKGVRLKAQKFKQAVVRRVPTTIHNAIRTQQALSARELWPSQIPAHIVKKGNADNFVAFEPSGNPNSVVLFLLPIPNQRGDQALVFFNEILRDATGLEMSKMFLAPCVRYGEKALTANTAEILDWLRLCLARKKFRFLISLGDDASRWIVNDGKKVPAAYAGQLLYPPKLGHIPLFIFPEVKALNPEFLPETDDKAARENYFRRDYAQKFAVKLNVMARLLVAHMTRLGITRPVQN